MAKKKCPVIHRLSYTQQMILAIIEGRKTETRRVPAERYLKWQPGDLIWIAESWRIGMWNHHNKTIFVDYKADNFCRPEPIVIDDYDRFTRYWIDCSDDADKAGNVPDNNGNHKWEIGQSPCRWRSGRFMPKAVARLWLKILSVEKQRLHRITNKQIINEGCPKDIYVSLAVRNWWFKTWDEINLKRASGIYAYCKNPDVAVIRFKVISTDGKI